MQRGQFLDVDDVAEITSQFQFVLKQPKIDAQFCLIMGHRLPDSESVIKFYFTDEEYKQYQFGRSLSSEGKFWMEWVRADHASFILDFSNYNFL